MRLRFLKNPWGHTRWKGRFSPDDVAWRESEPQLAAKLGYEVGAVDDGSFWISWEEPFCTLPLAEMNMFFLLPLLASKANICYFPLLVLKAISHYWKCVDLFFPWKSKGSIIQIQDFQRFDTNNIC